MKIDNAAFQSRSDRVRRVLVDAFIYLMAHAELRWSCYRCGTRFHDRVAWCPTCASENLVGPSAMRPHSAVELAPQVASARELAAAQWSLIVSARYPAIRLMRGALVLLYGPPGGGKSTMALGLVDGIGQRSVVYLSEEGLAPSVGERLVRLGLRDERMRLVARASLDQLAGVMHEHRAPVLVVDSVNAATLTAADLRHLMVIARTHVLVAVQQITKAGAPAGSNALVHEADVVIEVQDARWQIVKSRYQAPGAEGVVNHGN